jgi:hypothetical protein
MTELLVFRIGVDDTVEANDQCSSASKKSALVFSAITEKSYQRKCITEEVERHKMPLDDRSI